VTAPTDGLIDRINDAGFLIGADRVAKGGGGSYLHHNPTTGEVQAEVPLGGSGDIADAVAAAQQAATGWAATPVDQRARVLFRLADLLEAHGDEIAAVGALENGSPVNFNPGAYAGRWVRYYAGWADKLDGQVVPVYPGNGLDYIRPEPYGVVGVLPPWNGPLMGMGQKAAPALAAGNAVVAKPPELAPFGAYLFAELALEAGLPPGVLNVVAGGAEAGDALVRHPGVGKVSFTGGRVTARKVMAAAAETLKPLAFELGGKSANIVFPDVDLDTVAVMAASLGVILLSGQGCALPTRLFVHDDIYDPLVARVLAVVDGVQIGDPLDPATAMGPVITQDACRRILGVVADAVAAGAGALLCGGAKAGGDLSNGYFVEPTVFGDVDYESDLARQEVFGPVLSILRFSDEDEVVDKANDSDYGLGAYVHTNDLTRAHRVAHRLVAGSVTVNGFPTMCPTAPFGGFKQSGFGREGGRAGIEEFVRLKNVWIGL
jgi:aldehyde dehydrogenase (NAD+)